MLRETGIKNKQKRCSDREQCVQKLHGASSNQRCQGVMRKKDIPEKCVLKAFKNKSSERIQGEGKVFRQYLEIKGVQKKKKKHNSQKKSVLR